MKADAKNARGGPIRRQPPGFWTVFTQWWHAEYARTQQRPTPKSIQRWYDAFGHRVWGDKAVSYEEVQRHANRMKPKRTLTCTPQCPATAAAAPASGSGSLKEHAHDQAAPAVQREQHEDQQPDEMLEGGEELEQGFDPESGSKGGPGAYGQGPSPRRGSLSAHDSDSTGGAVSGDHASPAGSQDAIAAAAVLERRSSDGAAFTAAAAVGGGAGRRSSTGGGAAADDSPAVGSAAAAAATVGRARARGGSGSGSGSGPSLHRRVSEPLLAPMAPPLHGALSNSRFSRRSSATGAITASAGGGGTCASELEALAGLAADAAAAAAAAAAPAAGLNLLPLPSFGPRRSSGSAPVRPAGASGSGSFSAATQPPPPSLLPGTHLLPNRFSHGTRPRHPLHADLERDDSGAAGGGGSSCGARWHEGPPPPAAKRPRLAIPSDLDVGSGGSFSTAASGAPVVLSARGSNRLASFTSAAATAATTHLGALAGRSDSGSASPGLTGALTAARLPPPAAADAHGMVGASFTRSGPAVAAAAGAGAGTTASPLPSLQMLQLQSAPQELPPPPRWLLRDNSELKELLDEMGISLSQQQQQGQQQQQQQQQGRPWSPAHTQHDPLHHHQHQHMPAAPPQQQQQQQHVRHAHSYDGSLQCSMPAVSAYAAAAAAAAAPPHHLPAPHPEAHPVRRHPQHHHHRQDQELLLAPPLQAAPRAAQPHAGRTAAVPPHRAAAMDDYVYGQQQSQQQLYDSAGRRGSGGSGGAAAAGGSGCGYDSGAGAAGYDQPYLQGHPQRPPMHAQQQQHHHHHDHPYHALKRMWSAQPPSSLPPPPLPLPPPVPTPAPRSRSDLGLPFGVGSGDDGSAAAMAAPPTFFGAGRSSGGLAASPGGSPGGGGRVSLGGTYYEAETQCEAAVAWPARFTTAGDGSLRPSTIGPGGSGVRSGALTAATAPMHAAADAAVAAAGSPATAYGAAGPDMLAAALPQFDQPQQQPQPQPQQPQPPQQPQQRQHQQPLLQPLQCAHPDGMLWHLEPGHGQVSSGGDAGLGHPLQLQLQRQQQQHHHHHHHQLQLQHQQHQQQTAFYEDLDATAAGGYPDLH
ncbi:hypothetical protein HYH02_002545 [Chlamydomonas schloesseri]|uniref:Uncharacterized protein n=1 Tax=Chlamydomonas schloesseri TaxID=2026947 RepID=A0A835WSM4_9CHLO|nr:hypothetical protein HYH02_002545 [Chlamydomonas schloesseri]|eukprot:KAG2453222.1 hypothetical protein HYH02_002545 [Chlamydomonas schloesseri]